MTEELKRLVGVRAADMVEDGMVVGLGTGSTAKYAILRLGKRMKDEGIKITGISTSRASSDLAREVGIPLSTVNDDMEIDITIDGADEVDPEFNLIKGMGGALLWEKIVASATKHEIIIVDDSKLVEVLGTRSPLPVEVLQFGWKKVQQTLRLLGCEPVLRQRDGKPFVTDSGNYILDCRFVEILNPKSLEIEINNIPGVIENGLFLGIAKTVVVGSKDGVKVMVREE